MAHFRPNVNRSESGDKKIEKTNMTNIVITNLYPEREVIIQPSVGKGKTKYGK